MHQGLNLRTENRLLPLLWIQVRSVPVGSYCSMYNPPLEVCCPFFNGQLVQRPPAAFRGNVWTKKICPPRLLQACQRAQVQNLGADLVQILLPCSLKNLQVWGCERQQLTSSLLPLPHNWGDIQSGETVLGLSILPSNHIRISNASYVEYSNNIRIF